MQFSKYPVKKSGNLLALRSLIRINRLHIINRSYSFFVEYNDIYPLQSMGSEYFEADRDHSASLRLFISCQQTRRQWLNEKLSERLTTKTLRYNASFQFWADCIR